MKVDPRIRAKLLRAYPTRTKAVNDYVQFLASAPVPVDGDDFHGHHMLPRNGFPQFSDFHLSPWNQRALFIRDHNKAHQFLRQITASEISPEPWNHIQFQLLPQQLKWLKAEKNRTGSSIAELIRRAIDSTYPPAPEEKK